LNVFDEGRLTDRFGRVTNFRSAIIIMTSNLGADRQSLFGFGSLASTNRNAYRDAARDFFRPEFFNRLDGVVTFSSLGQKTILKIVRKELLAIQKREGFERGTLQLQWSEALIEHLARIGFDARYGARPLQRTIEREVVAPLAKWLLRSTGPEGILRADWVDGQIRFAEE
jgi:ATP-dependent Clp protease ATP-binding subunit ClpA